MMSLSEIIEKAKPLADLFMEYDRWKNLFRKGAMGNQQAYAEARDTRKYFEESKWVSVDDLKQWLSKIVEEFPDNILVETYGAKNAKDETLDTIPAMDFYDWHNRAWKVIKGLKDVLGLPLEGSK